MPVVIQVVGSCVKTIVSACYSMWSYFAYYYPLWDRWLLARCSRLSCWKILLLLLFLSCLLLKGPDSSQHVDDGVKPEQVLNKAELDVNELKLYVESWAANISKEQIQEVHDKWNHCQESMAKLQEQYKAHAENIGILKLLLNAALSAEALILSCHEENRKLQEHVNRLENELQAYTRQSCTALLPHVEDQFSSLLMKVMEEKPDERFAPLQSSFTEWIAKTTIRREEVDSLSVNMEARVMENISGEINRVMGNASKLLATEMQEINPNVLPSSLSSSDGVCLFRDGVESLIDNKLMHYDADKTAMADFALESAGGTILSTRGTETYSSGFAMYTVLGLPIWYSVKSPRTVIQPEVYPGQCWPIKGSKGFLVIGLSAIIRPTAFSLEHIPKSLSMTGSIDSAPKDFSVWGLVAENDYEGKILGQYTYREDGPPLQLFIVQNPDPRAFSIIELRIHSNHGNEEYTCLYRFRVHGMRE